jgi:hypothetical protein
MNAKTPLYALVQVQTVKIESLTEDVKALKERRIIDESADGCE